MEIVSVQKMDGCYLTSSALARAREHPAFRFSLSCSAVIIYLIQYVVCQGKYNVILQCNSHFSKIFLELRMQDCILMSWQ